MTRHGLAAAGATTGRRFHPIVGPAGAPPSTAHFNETNRDFASAGRYAIAAWSRGRTVRVSVGRF